jgi:hypothetical protein
MTPVLLAVIILTPVAIMTPVSIMTPVATMNFKVMMLMMSAWKIKKHRITRKVGRASLSIKFKRSGRLNIPSLIILQNKMDGFV